MVFDFDQPHAAEDERVRIDQPAPATTGPQPTPQPAAGDRWFYVTIGLLAGLALALAAVVFWPQDEAALTPADVDAAITQALADQAGPLLAASA